jgi:hypothetical protein
MNTFKLCFQIQLAALQLGLAASFEKLAIDHGMAVQVHAIKPTLKAPGPKRLKLKHDEVLSSLPGSRR